ncbi:MAG: hypothetical protein ACRDT6_03275 [Micromonosporaceae bacterium]
MRAAGTDRTVLAAPEAPADPCALVSEQTLKRVVPDAKVTRSESDNDSRHSKRASCEIETSGDSTSATSVSLKFSITRHGVRQRGRAAEAREAFNSSRQQYTGENLTDVPDLGDSAYAKLEHSGSDIEVLVAVLTGGDTFAVRYYVWPSGDGQPMADELALLATVAVARDLVNGLR